MAKEKDNKIPLGLKILVGFSALSLIAVITDFQTYFDKGYILGFEVGSPWSIISNLISVILGVIVPIMSVFNRKLVFWKWTFWYLIYTVITGAMLILKGLLNPSEVHPFMVMVFVIISGLMGLVTWYYYSKKSFFNKK